MVADKLQAHAVAGAFDRSDLARKMQADALRTHRIGQMRAHFGIEAVQHAPASHEHVDLAAAKAELQELVNAGLGTWERASPTGKGGRPTETFVATTTDETPSGGVKNGVVSMSVGSASGAEGKIADGGGDGQAERHHPGRAASTTDSPMTSTAQPEPPIAPALPSDAASLPLHSATDTDTPPLAVPGGGVSSVDSKDAGR